VQQGYEFTEDWFSHVVPVWEQLFYSYEPSRILEIGSYEGRSTCFIIQSLASARDMEIHCIDTWEGGVEHDRSAMSAVERRFDNNLARVRANTRHQVDFHKHKGLSSDVLARLIAAQADLRNPVERDDGGDGVSLYAVACKVTRPTARADGFPDRGALRALRAPCSRRLCSGRGIRLCAIVAPAT